ncbi:MAG: LysR family transcriptional regulator [Pseudomonadota bacterium]|jgi:DNA-binding transcriptional LysR family regulator
MPPSADNIATFVEVVRRQSLSAAARSLGLPKSTVSRRLVRLEEELHSQLLQRESHKFALTAVGRRFYGQVVAAVDALELAVTQLEQQNHEPRGTIRLTAPPDLGRMVLAPMFVAFLERHADISLDVVLTNRTVDLVQEGIDVAVRASRLSEGSLIARKLCEAELQLAVSKERPGDSEPSNIRSLEQRPFVLHRATGSSQVIKLERAHGASRAQRKSVELTVSGRVNVDDYAALAELVAAGQGVGLMPAIHVRDGVSAGRLVRVFPEWSSRAAHVYLVYATRQQPERVRLLSEFLLASFASHGNV